ncbi:ANTAR domain-containing protein [Streptomyces albicerus]|uniref:ANTAR domain-containing protein n=1 Tax=Streptomyces albicerus TaxID=2569859 RepID=UPI00124B689D|nr:ANTAR domain-containing protein [Streptomyces albicerus]
MQRTSVIQEEWGGPKAEVSRGDAPVGQDVVALLAENDQLRRALSGRVVIDQACGMVMALTPCRRGAARNLLVDVSRQCDLKLREVAAYLVATSEGEQLPGQIQRALRRALRRLHTADLR